MGTMDAEDSCVQTEMRVPWIKHGGSGLRRGGEGGGREQKGKK